MLDQRLLPKRTLDSRRLLRLPVLLRSRIGNSQFGARPVDLTDISILGCRVTAPFQWSPGTRLLLTIPSLAAMAATVQWSSVSALGLAFEKPLHPFVLDHLALNTVRDGQLSR